MTYVEKMTSEDTGGGVMVDVVRLKDGRCLGITDECVVLCPDFEGVFTATADFPSIDLLPSTNLIPQLEPYPTSHTPAPWIVDKSKWIAAQWGAFEDLERGEPNLVGDILPIIAFFPCEENEEHDLAVRCRRADQQGRTTIKGKTVWTDAERWGNANLIAAAPELLQALVFCLSFLKANDDGEDDVTERIKAAEKAIAKATNH